VYKKQIEGEEEKGEGWLPKPFDRSSQWFGKNKAQTQKQMRKEQVE